MKNLDYKNKLIEFYKNSECEKIYLDERKASYISYILGRISNNKAVYTVLITLSLYKVCHPEQDIRQHKIELPNGFSGRSFDTSYVTPTLKELGLPAMAESGWLTRSLEQAYSYDFTYNGKITPQALKVAFLEIVDYIQQGKENAENVLLSLLKGGIEFRKSNIISIQKIENADIKISSIIQILKMHFEENYHTHGGSKLPVIAFYAIYSILVEELSRFNNCQLSELGSHTASDRTSKSGGDIEIFKSGELFEALEIKLDKSPNAHMVRIAYDKINKFGISRYYILSGLPIQETDKEEVDLLISEIQDKHGCQLIVNGLYPSLNYYLRLISNPNLFLNKYIDLVTNDHELQKIHKDKLSSLLENIEES